jgi:hypothetical protein
MVKTHKRVNWLVTTHVNESTYRINQSVHFCYLLIFCFWSITHLKMVCLSFLSLSSIVQLMCCGNHGWLGALVVKKKGLNNIAHGLFWSHIIISIWPLLMWLEKFPLISANIPLKKGEWSYNWSLLLFKVGIRTPPTLLIYICLGLR